MLTCDVNAIPPSVEDLDLGVLTRWTNGLHVVDAGEGVRCGDCENCGSTREVEIRCQTCQGIGSVHWRDGEDQTCGDCDGRATDRVPCPDCSPEHVVYARAGDPTCAGEVPPNPPDEPHECRSRPCTGGPHGRWCGRPSRFVARDEAGMEWFACPDHTEGTGTRGGTRCLPVADWFTAQNLPFPDSHGGPNAR